MKPLPFIMQYVRRYKYRYIAGILTLFAVDAASVFIPKLTGIITDGLTARSTPGVPFVPVFLESF